MTFEVGTSRRMKFQVDKDSPSESKINSKWKQVGDTNLGHINLREFKKRMHDTDTQLPTTIEKKMIRNGIVQAASFLPAMQCTKLIAECFKHYNPENIEIVAPNGRILANIGEVAIREAFRIPEYHNTIYMTRDEATQLYNNHIEQYDANINHSWLEKPRKGISKIPKLLVRAYFKEDYRELIALLNRVMGS